MAIFHYGFISGTGTKTEYQLWDDSFKNHSAGIETRKVDEIIGAESSNTDFRDAPYICKSRLNPQCGFIICGFDKDQIMKLALLFIKYFSSIDESFGKVPYHILNKRKNEELPINPVPPKISISFPC